MFCNKCNTEVMIVRAEPQKIEDKPYLVQVFACNNPNCADYKKELGEIRHDFLEPTNPIIEIRY